MAPYWENQNEEQEVKGWVWNMYSCKCVLVNWFIDSIVLTFMSLSLKSTLTRDVRFPMCVLNLPDKPLLRRSNLMTLVFASSHVTPCHEQKSLCSSFQFELFVHSPPFIESNNSLSAFRSGGHHFVLWARSKAVPRQRVSGAGAPLEGQSNTELWVSLEIRDVCDVWFHLHESVSTNKYHSTLKLPQL